MARARSIWRERIVNASRILLASISGRGYFVSTVGRDEAQIREYIRRQEAEDTRLDQLQMWK
jgi:REP element-mobilizing transposase RayT